MLRSRGKFYNWFYMQSHTYRSEITMFLPCTTSDTPRCIRLRVILNIHRSGKNPLAHQQGSHSLNTSAKQHPQTTILPVATNKARHIREWYRTVSKSSGVSVLYSLSQRSFFSHYFLVNPLLVPIVASKVQQSVNMSIFGCFGFLTDTISKKEKEKSSHPQIAAGLGVHLGSLNVLSQG